MLFCDFTQEAAYVTSEIKDAKDEVQEAKDEIREAKVEIQEAKAKHDADANRNSKSSETDQKT